MNDTPMKPLKLNLEDKENAPVSSDVAEPELKKVELEATKPAEAQVVKAKTPKELEAEEPLLQENPQRFVLFPIKYHEVCWKLVTRFLRV